VKAASKLSTDKYTFGVSPKIVSGWDLMLNDCSGYGQKSSAPSSMPYF